MQAGEGTEIPALNHFADHFNLSFISEQGGEKKVGGVTALWSYFTSYREVKQKHLVSIKCEGSLNL